MDGLRKVPDTVPESHRAEFELCCDVSADIGGVPLTSVANPYPTADSSYGAHNNARLRGFLDAFGFDYEFQSSTEMYNGGRFDQVLLDILRNYDRLLPLAEATVREDRRRNYGLFLPLVPDAKLSERLGRPLRRYVYVRPKKTDGASGTIDFVNPIDGKPVEGFPVTGGNCKLLWRVDWAMRWMALDVDYEMSGKDLIDSVKLSSQICEALKRRPPLNLTYELFLDELGQKISKSKGNGLSVEDWLKYAPWESLALFMFQKPKAAKRLYFDVIPRAVDDYVQQLEAFPAQEAAQRLENPVWHIHDGKPPPAPGGRAHLTFGILLNLASVVNAEDKQVLWGFIARYAPEASPATDPLLDTMVERAIAYYRDFVKPTRRFRAPSDVERAALGELEGALARLPAGAAADVYQNEVFEVGKRHFAKEQLRQWFQALYEILLGQSQGPRFGSFVALYGRDETIRLIGRGLKGELAASQAS
jgi:lysyl-tRNA synthetase class 1